MYFSDDPAHKLLHPSYLKSIENESVEETTGASTESPQHTECMQLPAKVDRGMITVVIIKS